MDIQELRKQLTQVADCFYQARNEEGFQLFLSVTAQIGAVKEFIPYINPLFDALEQDDFILAADILQHDMVEKIKKNKKRG